MHGRGGMRGSGGGHAWQGGVHAMHTPQQILRDTVNERPVRILLECILADVSIPLLKCLPSSRVNSFSDDTRQSSRKWT